MALYSNTLFLSGEKFEFTTWPKCNRIKRGALKSFHQVIDQPPRLRQANTKRLRCLWGCGPGSAGTRGRVPGPAAAPATQCLEAPLSCEMSLAPAPAQAHSSPQAHPSPCLPHPKELTYILPLRQDHYYKSWNINYTFIFLWFFFLLLQFSFQYKLPCQKDISDVSNSPL